PEEDEGSRYFVDCYPEVVTVGVIRSAERMMQRRHLPYARCRDVLSQIVERGSCYVPELNLLLVHRLRMQSATKDVACFVHHACRDFSEVDQASGRSVEEDIYLRAMEEALVHFGARVLYPSHLLNEEEDLFSMYAGAREEVEASTGLRYRECMRLLDSVVLHRDYELHARSYATRPALLEELLTGTETSTALLANHLGELLGGDLYRAYLAGRLSRHEARSLFFRRLRKGSARAIYFSVVARVRQRRSDLLAA
ncbi:MAG TPA: hypothetical protein VM912_04385, partial [Terriglobales bacterium]|nr:hypothetical protein [Terriglobales bacterium]